jgi:hypothetical protein
VFMSAVIFASGPADRHPRVQAQGAAPACK